MLLTKIESKKEEVAGAVVPKIRRCDMDKRAEKRHYTKMKFLFV